MIAVKQLPDGSFVILKSSLVGATGGNPNMPADADFYVHWHNNGFSDIPDTGDRDSTVTQDKSMFTVAWSTSGKCCTAFEVGRQAGEYLYREVRRNGSVKRWTDRGRKEWNSD